MSIKIKAFYHPSSCTISYLIWCSQTNIAASIDAPLDYCPVSGQIDTQLADQIIAQVNEMNLQLEWVLETHAHADHLSAAQYIKQQLGGKTAIGKDITFVQQTFKSIFNLNGDFSTDGRQFDRLLTDGERLALGNTQITVLSTPGHTNDSVTYLVNNHAFVGDTLFMPDSGTSRCDFPGGDAATLYDSIHKIFALGDETQLWLCHDYQPNGRELCYQTTVAEQKANNIHIAIQHNKQEFVTYRTNRDQTLSLPQLIFPAIQINIAAGQLPQQSTNGTRYIKIPLTGATHF